MEKQSVHFIGIGGIGMSSLAQYFLSHGYAVSGSDLEETETLQILRNAGARITIGNHIPKNIPKETENVIISAAIKKENSEFAAARKRHLKIKTYAEAVGELTKKYETIAVAGAHGKSTSTALAALILEKAGFDPTVIVGTKLHEWGGKNFRLGNGKYLVLEADEHKEAFLRYTPKIAIVTNIDEEHLDHYRTIENIRKAFKTFLQKVPKDGFIILNKDDSWLADIGKKMRANGKNVVFYSLDSAPARHAAKIFKLPGRHMLSNATAVLALAKNLKIPTETALQVLSEYKGSWRRSEYKGKFAGAHVFDDYAHHPTEIKATLAGFRERYPLSRIWCIFQPHQQERLNLLFGRFTKAFHHADRIVLLDTYKVLGREKKYAVKKSAGVEKTSFDLARAIDSEAKKRAFYLDHPEELPRFLKDSVFENDIILMMGAGNINHWTKTLIS